MATRAQITAMNPVSGTRPNKMPMGAMIAAAKPRPFLAAGAAGGISAALPVGGRARSGLTATRSDQHCCHDGASVVGADIRPDARGRHVAQVAALLTGAAVLALAPSAASTCCPALRRCHQRISGAAP
jgi:hypothetical protein